jgi:RNA polymerase sigma factor (TIGR02999 family)
LEARDRPETIFLYNPSVTDLGTLLDRFEQGDRAALDEMMPSIYSELKRLARIYLSRERGDHTLQPTALVHEAYMKLVEQRRVDWRNRAHVLGVAARMMRRVLLHHAEDRNAQKRYGALERVTLDEAIAALESNAAVDLSQLNVALDKLAARDERQARIVELRVFGGLTIDETAEAVGLSPATVKRDWNVARLFLRRELA